MTHFDFQGADYISACFELKRRNIATTLRKDSYLPCLVRGCARKLKRAERAYYPSRSLGKHNKIMAHVDCVNRVVAEHTAKSAAEAASAKHLILDLPTHDLAAGSSNGPNPNGQHESPLLTYIEQLLLEAQQAELEIRIRAKVLRDLHERASITGAV